MITCKQLAGTLACTAAVATMCFAHTESPGTQRAFYRGARQGWFAEYEESVQNKITRTASRAQQATQKWPPQKWSDIPSSDFSNKNHKGITVEHGGYLGKPLYWIAKWWPEADDVPGLLPDSGSTSAWKLLNSSAAGVENPNPEWLGADITPGSQAKVTLPTWNDGAKGAYAIISDDIGAFNDTTGFEAIVAIAEEANAKEREYFGGYNAIRVGFSVQVDKSDELEWEWMRTQIKRGHEMLNHSYNHTSAAHQWKTFYQDDAVGDTAAEIHSFTQAYGDTLPISGTIAGYDHEYVSHLAYIDVLEEKKLHLGKDVPKWVSGGIVLSPDGFDKINAPVERFGNYEVKNTSDHRYIKANTQNWINKTQPWVLVLDCAVRMDDAEDPQDEWGKWYDGWDANEFVLNVERARDTIDINVYDKLRDENKLESMYWPANKNVDFFVYPYDAFDSSTHAYLEENGYIGARGGSKGANSTPLDFFHPFRTDFDAHYGDKYGTYDQGTNPHQYLTLEGMLDTIVSQRGFHTRETHTVTTRTDLGFGPIAPDDFKKHVTDLMARIKKNDITMYTPTDAVKYRITRDNMSIDVSESGSEEWKITPTITLANEFHETYRDILLTYSFTLPTSVNVPEGKTLRAEYEDGTLVRRQPWIRPGSTVWSVYGDPYKGAVKVTIDDPQEVSNILTPGMLKSSKAHLAGIEQGKLQLKLPEAGDYRVDVFTAMGRMVKSQSISVNDANSLAAVEMNSLAKGVFILNITKAGKSLLQKRFLVQ